MHIYKNLWRMHAEIKNKSNYRKVNTVKCSIWFRTHKALLYWLVLKSTGYKLELSEKRKPPLRRCSYQIACRQLCGPCLINDWRGQAYARRGVLYWASGPAVFKKGNWASQSAAPFIASASAPDWILFTTVYKQWDEINFPQKLTWTLGFITAIESHQDNCYWLLK